MIVRRLGPGDEDVVAALATGTPRTALLADDRTFFLVAFEDHEPAGFVLAYELLRRHGDPTSLFVYEVQTAEAFRGRGVATVLMRELEGLARSRGIRQGFVLTNEGNEAAMRLYASVGGTRPNRDDVQWDFEYAASRRADQSA